jgi:integrase
MWARLAAKIGLSGVTFHALRHTHASQLIASGIDVVRIAKRIGREPKYRFGHPCTSFRRGRSRGSGSDRRHPEELRVAIRWQ